MDQQNRLHNARTPKADETNTPLQNMEQQAEGQGVCMDQESALARVGELENLQADLIQARTAAEEANRTKSRFLAIMSHEIRTPLNGVLGALQLLFDTNPDPRQLELIDLGRSSAESLRGVANDVIDLSRLEADGMKLEPVTFNMAELIQDVCDFWRPMAVTKGLSLEITIEENLPELVVGDSARIRQIINNYLSNAINFTDRGGIAVKLALDKVNYSSDVDKSSVYIEVNDTGIGISRNDQKRLFKDYSQLKNKADCQRSGAGLGLAICRELSNLMDGNVGVTSKPDEGSSFWLRLPVQVGTRQSEESNSPAKTNDLAPIFTESVGQPVILLVEDSVTNQMIAQAFLESFGCHVEVAGDGLEAINAVRQRNYDAILMDVAMPRMDGVDATRQIRAMAGDLPPVQIIGQTAFVTEEETMEFLAAGMNEVVNKPLDKKTLHRALSEALKPVSMKSITPAVPSLLSTYIDTNVLGALSKNLTDSQLDQLIERVIIDIENTGREAVSGAKKGEVRTLARACHTLKGLGASFGNPELESISSGINTACRNHDLARASALALSKLESVCEKSIVALKAYTLTTITNAHTVPE